MIPLSPAELAEAVEAYLAQLDVDVARGIFADGDPHDCEFCFGGDQIIVRHTDHTVTTFRTKDEVRDHLWRHLAFCEVRLATLWWAAAAFADRGNQFSHELGKPTHLTLIPRDKIGERMQEFFLLMFFDNPFVQEKFKYPHHPGADGWTWELAPKKELK